MSENEAKSALDKIIKKSRVHFYKPIQIAEILYHNRTGARINLEDLEAYRNSSKIWRDEITKRLVGRVSTSSQKYQDNIFESNAMTPKNLKSLSEYNKNGLVEAYVYTKLKERLGEISEARAYLNTSNLKFDLKEFLSIFESNSGLKRSIDKAYEIVVYSLFDTIITALQIEINMKINTKDKELLSQFSKFIELVFGFKPLAISKPSAAKIFRAGITNAADRGVDIWGNFGSYIQVKHLSLDESLMESLSDTNMSGRLVLVCNDVDATILKKIKDQALLTSNINSIITISDLENWYNICLSIRYRKTLGTSLLQILVAEFDSEFPSLSQIEPFMKARSYKITPTL